MTRAEFDYITEGMKLSPKMKSALIEIMVLKINRKVISKQYRILPAILNHNVTKILEARKELQNAT